MLTMKLFMLGFFFSMNQATATTPICRPLLWPADSPIINQSRSIPQDTLATLQKWSNKWLDQSPHPIPILSSSGRVVMQDPMLIASRKAIKDADKTALLALTYRVTHKVIYLNKARDFLISWAKVNTPTGNPIDETRLDGMIWAYDLISCDLSESDKTQILAWFEQLHAKKAAWAFGPITSTNNYRIHQLKMLLLLDKIVQLKQNLASDEATAIKYSSINLYPPSGMSIDYMERSALYYHNYVLQPWLEINLITGCCLQPVNEGFAFLSEKILSHETRHEFSDSDAEIDTLRANGGFAYAKKGGTFDVSHAAPTIAAYYTLTRDHHNPKLWSILQQAKPSPRMAFLNARRLLWKP